MLMRSRPLFYDILKRYSSTSNSSYALLDEARTKLKNVGEGKVHLTKDESTGIACITLDNLEKKNALSGFMMMELENVIEELESWNCGKGVILTSKGNIFCSGGDIASLSRNNLSNQECGMLMSTFMHHILTRFFCLPLISVTHVNGKAIGGGAELTTATDFRVFTEKSEVTFVQGKMGLATGWGGGTRLVKHLGPRLALDLLLTSRKLLSEEALHIGFADHLINGSDSLSQTIDWLGQRTSHHYSVVRAMKQIVVGARDLNFEDSLLNERKIFSPLWGGPVNQEALSKNIKHR